MNSEEGPDLNQLFVVAPRIKELDGSLVVINQRDADVLISPYQNQLNRNAFVSFGKQDWVLRYARGPLFPIASWAKNLQQRDDMEWDIEDVQQ